MFYHVEMTVNLPVDMPKSDADAIKLEEKLYAQDLMRAGKWVHIWRLVGEYANVSVFDVTDHDELHDLLSGLPLFPYMQIRVRALARHPSAL
ncbi:MAG: muconolactone Delta-isomerase [Pseudomonadota bacterium]